MKFRLTYQGILFPSQPMNENKLNEKAKKLGSHKHRIRKHFHCQLKKLWHTSSVLSRVKICTQCGANHALMSDEEKDSHPSVPLKDYISGLPNHSNIHGGYTLCPLVCDELDLICSVDILMLRMDMDEHRRVIDAGDIDNRVKTIIDCLKSPSRPSDVGVYTNPSDGESPFYSLMHDDKLVSGLHVESDILLDSDFAIDPDDKRDNVDMDGRKVRVIATATVKAASLNLKNLTLSS